MDRRLLYLHNFVKSLELLCRKRIIHDNSLRSVSCLASKGFHPKTTLFRPLFLLGYIPGHNRVYLADKDVNVYSYALALSLVEYQTAVLRGDMESANEILPNIPKEQRTKVATFLEGRGTLRFANGYALVLINLA